MSFNGEQSATAILAAGRKALRLRKCYTFRQLGAATRLMGQRSEHVTEKIGLTGCWLQMRIPITFMVRNGICLENLGIFDKQVDSR